jgi:DNA-directed RNA polymerase specialized sigma subunit
MVVFTERFLTKPELAALRLVAPVTHRELGVLLGISETRVIQLEQRALRKITDALSVEKN